jgi:hypothetical protein
MVSRAASGITKVFRVFVVVVIVVIIIIIIITTTINRVYYTANFKRIQEDIKD